MKTVLVTGASGFIGKNLCAALERIEDVKVLKFTRKNSSEDLTKMVASSDFIFHIAGVNRTEEESDFDTVNRGLTESLLSAIDATDKRIPVLITSSTHAELDNAYGKSKKAAEESALIWAKKNNNQLFLYRLTNVFGKWSNPNYNTVVATFCNNVAKGIELEINDPSHKLTLVYIDAVVQNFIKAFMQKLQPTSDNYYAIEETHTITLGELAEKIKAFNQNRTSLVMPSLKTAFDRYLYATFTSFLPENDYSYPLRTSADERGLVAEFIKSDYFGQVFFSKTLPGIIRGNHWHNTKVEKFLVVSGQGAIKFRKVNSDEVLTYKVSGDKLEVVDIPTGYVHSIENTGTTELLTLIWASEIFDPEAPDTLYEEV